MTIRDRWTLTIWWMRYAHIMSVQRFGRRALTGWFAAALVFTAEWLLVVMWMDSRPSLGRFLVTAAATILAPYPVVAFEKARRYAKSR